MDKFKAVESFVAVSKSGSFHRAAKLLGVSNAMISKRIAQLEDHLGARLLHRTTRKISLTEAGGDYAELWDDLLQRVRDQETSLSNLQSLPRGLLRVVAPRSLGDLQIAAAIAQFVKAYPELRVELELTATSPSALQLVEGGFDVGIRIIPPPSSARAVARKLVEYGFKVCASPEFLQAHGSPASPSDLSRFRCITTPILNAQVRFRGDWEFMRGAKRISVKIKPAVTVNSLAALRVMTLHAGGIARLPAYCVDADLSAGRLVQVLETYGLEPGVIYAMYYRGKASEKVQLFIKFLRRELKMTRDDLKFKVDGDI